MSSSILAETKILSETHIKGKSDNKYKFAIRTLCIDGYKFVVVRDIRGGIALSIVQYFENQNGNSVPAKCN